MPPGVDWILNDTALAFLAATAVGLVEATAYIGYALSEGGLELGVGGVLVRVVPRWWLWAAFTPVIAWTVRGRDHWSGARALAGRLVLPGIGLSLAHLALWALFRHAIDASQLAYLADFTRLAVNFLALDFVTFLAIAAVLRGRDLLQGIRERERERADLAVRNSNLQARLAEARLQALASQLRPHFLFNALNAVSELVHQDPAEAERLVARLGDLLRLVLDRTERHEVTLAEELEIVGAYLDIERSRFRGRLDAEIRVDPRALGALVPTLSIQPLVENAVRHGVERDRGAGRVTLRAGVEGAELRISVADDGPGAERDSVRDGIGLANTRSRLAELYGPRGDLRLEPGPGGGAVAVLTLPLRRGGPG